MHAPRTATETYRLRAAAIRANLDRIARALAGHERQQASEPHNWGYAGDLGSVVEQLAAVFGEES